MAISPMLFICLFFAGLSIFFMGVSAVWWVSLQARRLSDGASMEARRRSPG